MFAENKYRQPPIVTKSDGEVRRVGIELEFSGLSLDRAAGCVQSALGGDAQISSAATRTIVTPAGRFTVTIDWEYLIRRAAEEADRGENARWLNELSDAAAVLVPIEVICPPIPLTELARLDALTEALREAGATGTGRSVLAAYGLHINVEPSALDVSTIHSYTEAFGLLQWWLVHAHSVDVTRRLSPYIALYPEQYVSELLLRKDASIDDLASHYLDHNASRNRALDLLPLLAEFDARQVRAAVDDPRIQARPALHYRLPNCEVDVAGWSVSQAWNLWCIVEELASRPEERRQLADSFRARLRPLIGLDHSSWREHTDTWLQEREWV